MLVIIVSALISFFSIALLLTHISASAMRRLAGYAGWVDLVLHSTVIILFMGTSTHGLIQAEASAILFSLFLRGYRWWYGYERLHWDGWYLYAGARDNEH